MKMKINSLSSLLVGCLGVASLTTTVCSNAFAEINDNCTCFTPYVGVSAQREHLRFNERFGAPFYNRSLASGSLILGLKFSDYLGIEFDYTLSQRKNKIRTLVAGQFAPEAALPLPFGEFEIYKTRLAIDSINLGVTGHLPLDCMNFCNTSLFSIIGGSLLKVKANHNILQFSYTDLTPQQIIALSYRFKNSYRKLVPFIKMGIENKVTDRFAFRIFASWKQVTNFDTKSSGLSISKGHLKFSSSVGYGISILYYF
jgi:hypothetical protein